MSWGLTGLIGLGVAAGATAADALAADSGTGPALITAGRAARVRPATPREPDRSAPPNRRNPSVVRLPQSTPARASGGPTVGWSRTLRQPRFVDKRRRIPATARPHAFGDTLVPGERFRFDVSFAGNPAGLAEASVVAIEADPNRGGAKVLRLEGHARTSGIVSLLATVTDDLITVMDAETGAAITSVNTLHYDGWSPKKYKHRVTDAQYEGRGQVRITDTKDRKVKKKLMRVPIDTFDPLSAMAWVRSLDLEPGERAKAHTIDGMTLMRIEIESKGPDLADKMPSIAKALDLKQDGVTLLKGVLTRVDQYDQAIPGKRAFKLRAWVSNDERKIPLVLESDMWVGAIRLELSSYDPPHRANSGR